MIALPGVKVSARNLAYTFVLAVFGALFMALFGPAPSAQAAELCPGGEWTRPVMVKANTGANSDFGPRKRPTPKASKYHKGHDFGTQGKTPPLYAVADGKVVQAKRLGGAGKQVKIKLDGTNCVVGYAHMSSMSVRKHQHVDRGQVIGRVGDTGESDGKHLHFSLEKGSGRYVDPIPELKSHGVNPDRAGDNAPGSRTVSIKTKPVAHKEKVKTDKKKVKTDKKAAPAPVARGHATHTVRKGEYLSSIARDRGLRSWKPLYALNKHQIKDPDIIEIGQVLRLPGKARDKDDKAKTAVRAKAAPSPRVEKTSSTRPAGGNWARLRQCESGGNYRINTGNGYYGAYQFDLRTWRSVGYSGYPHKASPATQDAAARKRQAQRGWAPWPACSAKLGLSK